MYPEFFYTGSIVIKSGVVRLYVNDLILKAMLLLLVQSLRIGRGNM